MAKRRLKRTYTFDPITIEGIEELKSYYSPLIHSNSGMLEYLVLREIVNENVRLSTEYPKENIGKIRELISKILRGEEKGR